jgi:hypothetical protein
MRNVTLFLTPLLVFSLLLNLGGWCYDNCIFNDLDPDE